MEYAIKKLPFDPAKVKGLSEKLLVSHYENNYSGAVKRLNAITAAVVGVILNLAVWFALHVLFARLVPVHWLGASVDLPVVSSVDVPSLILSIAAAVAIFRFKFGMISVLLASSLAGVAYYLVVGLS